MPQIIVSMYDQNTRINAAITYFFMGPIFLFAKKGTPFSHSFVRSHAQRSTIYMAVFALIFFVFFNIKSYLYINIFGFSLDTLVFSGIFFIFLLLMLVSGYRAFHGFESNSLFEWKQEQFSSLQEGSYSEEEKIRIIAGLLPLFGIFISNKYRINEIYTARKIGNFFLFFILFFGFVSGSFINFPVFFLLIVWSVLFVSTAVLLMAKSQFLHLRMYHYIPTYHQIEAGLHTSLGQIVEFFRVAFGKEKRFTFQERYSALLQKYSVKNVFETPFWTHPAIISLPILNLITLPSFFQEKYHEYQGNIAEGILLSIYAILCFFLGNIFLLYFLLFPICTLMAESKNNANIRAPLTSIARNIFIFAYKTRQKISTLQEHTEEKTITITKNSTNIQETKI